MESTHDYSDRSLSSIGLSIVTSLASQHEEFCAINMSHQLRKHFQISKYNCAHATQYLAKIIKSEAKIDDSRAQTVQTTMSEIIKKREYHSQNSLPIQKWLKY